MLPHYMMIIELNIYGKVIKTKQAIYLLWAAWAKSSGEHDPIKVNTVVRLKCQYRVIQPDWERAKYSAWCKEPNTSTLPVALHWTCGLTSSGPSLLELLWGRLEGMRRPLLSAISSWSSEGIWGRLFLLAGVVFISCFASSPSSCPASWGSVWNREGGHLVIPSPSSPPSLASSSVMSTSPVWGCQRMTRKTPCYRWDESNMPVSRETEDSMQGQTPVYIVSFRRGSVQSMPYVLAI